MFIQSHEWHSVAVQIISVDVRTSVILFFCVRPSFLCDLLMSVVLLLPQIFRQRLDEWGYLRQSLLTLVHSFSLTFYAFSKVAFVSGDVWGEIMSISALAILFAWRRKSLTFRLREVHNRLVKCARDSQGVVWLLGDAAKQAWTHICVEFLEDITGTFFTIDLVH